MKGASYAAAVRFPPCGPPSGHPLSILLSTLAIALFLLAACGETPAEVVPTTSVATTTTNQATTTPPPTEATTTTLDVTTTTATATTTTAGVPEAQLEAAAAVGDMAAGEELFFEGLDGIHDQASCSTCHSLDPNNSVWAPSLAGIWTRAGGRVGGLTDVDYLRQSILDPGAFVVEGSWPFAMPFAYPEVLSDEQVNNLIAFLLTQ